MNLSVCTLTLYTLPNCPRCDEVGEILTALGYFYILKSMDNPDTLADMRFEGFFGIEAPVVKLNDAYYTYEDVLRWKTNAETKGDVKEMAMSEGSPIVKTTITDEYKRIMKDIFEVKEQRGKMYRKEPKDIVPIETLEHLAYLKAVRGMESLNLDKKIDEYTDLVNYAVFVLERLYKERSGRGTAGMKTDA